MTVNHQPILQLKDVTKKYNDFTAVESVNLTIQAGEFITLLGPSGSGKTTILQMIAGFTKPTHGEIYMKGEDISNKPPQKRNMGVVFQDYALFPHMTVYDNIAYPLKIRKLDKKIIANQVEETIDLVQLNEFKHRKPDELSGGQQQRVALARSLVFKPSLLLMDEPLGALDKKLREHVQLEIKKIQRMLGVTIVFVTHDQEEALVMSDRIAVLNDSKLVQLGTARELYHTPNNFFIADFIGENNFIPGVVTSITNQTIRVKANENKEIIIERSDGEDVRVGQEVSIAVRPENMQLSSIDHYDHNQDLNYLTGEVTDEIFLGDGIKYLIACKNLDQESTELAVIAKNNASLTKGQQVAISFLATNTTLFPRS